MAIDWPAVQAKLGVKPDGNPGVLTYAALLTYAAHGRDLGTMGPKMASICATMFPKYGISDTPNRLAQFLSTTSHETGEYGTFAEDLNYSIKNILETWGPGKGSRFKTADDAAPYAHNPQKLAEKVYGGRFGNPPGRAYDFRGGGWIQTTFYDNYLAAEKVTGLPLTHHPELLHDPLSSIEAACSYWKVKGCNELADKDPTGRLARVAVNGGTVGLPDVLQRVPRMMRIAA